jgi:hypothetical protein
LAVEVQRALKARRYRGGEGATVQASESVPRSYRNFAREMVPISLSRVALAVKLRGAASKTSMSPIVSPFTTVYTSE